MKVLIDECAPKALMRHLKTLGHDCLTAQEAGWAGKENGELLALAEANFDVLVTLDTNLRHQQNLAGRKIAIVVLLSRTNHLNQVRPLFSACANALAKIKPEDVVQVGSET